MLPAQVWRIVASVYEQSGEAGLRLWVGGFMIRRPGDKVFPLMVAGAGGELESKK